MSWKLLLLMLVNLEAIQSYSQCTITRDSAGQVITTCQYSTNKVLTTKRYLGSEFLTFPIWQSGALMLGATGRKINGLICYNVYTNQVFCQLDDSTTTEVFPDAFTINGAPFIRQSPDGWAGTNTSYYLLRYEGKTRLLENLKCTLEPVPTPFDRLGANSPYYAQYKKQSSYYVQKGNNKLKLIDLTKSSLLAILYEQSELLNACVTKDKLSLHEAIGVLASYDSLMAVMPLSSIPLNNDLIFREVLHEQIRYPNQAWNEGIYGRVYIGFEIDQQGQLKNIVPVSPENVGYGFIPEVRKALQRLPALLVSYAGLYVLPVAFSYTNASDKNHILYTPRNLLSSDKVGKRQVLDELRVPVIINKASLLDSPIHEVWGYYK